jgi:hypothetical protein
MFFEDSLVAHKPGPDEAIRISDDRGRSIRTDTSSDGQVTLYMRAPVREGEDDDLEVCGILLEKLEQNGSQHCFRLDVQ